MYNLYYFAQILQRNATNCNAIGERPVTNCKKKIRVSYTFVSLKTSTTTKKNNSLFIYNKSYSL